MTTEPPGGARSSDRNAPRVACAPRCPAPLPRSCPPAAQPLARARRGGRSGRVGLTRGRPDPGVMDRYGDFAIHPHTRRVRPLPSLLQPLPATMATRAPPRLCPRSRSATRVLRALRSARLRRSVPDHPPSAWVSRSGGQEPRERKFIDDRRERGHRRVTLCAGVTRPPRSVFLRFALEDDRKARRGHVTSSRDQAAAGCHPSWHPHWVAMPAHYRSAPRRRSSPLALNRAGFPGRSRFRRLRRRIRDHPPTPSVRSGGHVPQELGELLQRERGRARQSLSERGQGGVSLLGKEVAAEVEGTNASSTKPSATKKILAQRATFSSIHISPGAGLPQETWLVLRPTRICV